MNSTRKLGMAAITIGTIVAVVMLSAHKSGIGLGLAIGFIIVGIIELVKGRPFGR